LIVSYFLLYWPFIIMNLVQNKIIQCSGTDTKSKTFDDTSNLALIQSKAKRKRNIFYQVCHSISVFCMGPMKEEVDDEYIFKYHKNLKKLNQHFA
jgi:hypothetical protein